MAALTDQTIATSFEQLLHCDTNNGGNGATLVPIKDGDNGTTFCLQLSTTKAMIEGSGNKLYFHDEGDEHISAAGGDLTLAAGTALNITADVIDLSDATKDITLNNAVDAINFDSNTLSIDASNNRVGIGTASPNYLLDVEGTGAQIMRIYSSNNDASLYISSDTDEGQTSQIVFAADAFIAGRIAYSHNTGATNQNMRIYVGDNALVMGIEGNGRIGIGDSAAAPGALLHVVDNTTDDYACEIKNTHAGGWGLNVLACGGSSAADDPIFFCGDSGGNEKFKVRYDGATIVTGNFSISGSLTKGSGTFKIDHPLPSKKDTHHLVHSFIEGPKADLIYRGKVDLVSGNATVNIDTEAGMTAGTFVVLCDDVQCFTTNESNWDEVKGSVSGNILTIESKNEDSTASISWMVIGDRKDKHIIDIEWTDENGKPIVEPLKENA